MDKKQHGKTYKRPTCKPKKRRFHGNRFTDESGTDFASASAAKLKKSDDTSFDVHVKRNKGYSIIEFFLVFTALEQFLKCKTCDKDISFSKYGQRGLGFKVCLSCSCGDRFIDSCSMIGTGYEINRRLVYVMRLIGIGIHGINIFCGLMELGSGLNNKVYYDIVKSINTAVTSVFDIVSKKAINEEKILNREKGLGDDLTVSGDGSWAKRGFTSLIGIVSLIGKFSKKIVDVVVRSSYCKGCERWKGRENKIEYDAWYLKHKENCKANHTGSAGKMEVDGIVEMFIRSLEKFGVRYGSYIGDGDSKTFKMLLDVFPYGEQFLVKKLECVLHVSKRIFKRACEAKKILTQKRKAAKKLMEETPKKIPKKEKSARTKVVKRKKVVIKKVKTADLTIKLMKELSLNYGLAVQRNKDSVENMYKEIWAGYYHKISTDSNPQHMYCPISWCKYRKAEASNTLKVYKHPPALAQDVQEVLKPIYEDLTKEELLQRCIGGNTQNNNESFNKAVWSMAPKHVFCGKEIVEIACLTAACIFNEGFHPVLKIMEIMGIEIGESALQFADARDNARIVLADRHSSEASKEGRMKRREAKLDENEVLEHAEGILYGAGIAD